MGQAQINVRTRACSRTSIARTRQAALTHNVRGKELRGFDGGGGSHGDAEFRISSVRAATAFGNGEGGHARCLTEAVATPNGRSRKKMPK